MGFKGIFKTLQKLHTSDNPILKGMRDFGKGMQSAGPGASMDQRLGRGAGNTIRGRMGDEGVPVASQVVDEEGQTIDKPAMLPMEAKPDVINTPPIYQMPDYDPRMPPDMSPGRLDPSQIPLEAKPWQSSRPMPRQFDVGNMDDDEMKRRIMQSLGGILQ